MASSSFESSEAVPTEITPFDLSFAGPVPQGKKKKSSSRSVFSQVVVLFFLVGLCFTVYSRQTSLASSTSLVNQLISKSVNKNQNENENIVIPTASLVESKTKTRLQQVTKAATTTTTDSSVEASGKFILKFPPNVQQDVEKGNFDDIIPNCNKYLDENKWELWSTPSYMANILACRIDENRLLGTLKTGVNFLQLATDVEKIVSSEVSSLFVDNAFAIMIQRKCFLWDTALTSSKHIQTQYTGKDSYSREFTSKTGVSVSGSGSYAGVTVSAGYQQSITNSGGSEGSTESAYGQEKYSAVVGKLSNVCLSEARFDEIKDLVKPYWVSCWKAIRASGRSASVEDLLKNPRCFSAVADGGFLMPVEYIYRVGYKSTFSTRYTTSSTKEKKGASQAISAGISAARGGFGGSITTKIDNAISESRSTSSFEGYVSRDTETLGYDINLSCYKKNNCDDVIEDSVKAIRGNYTKLGKPTIFGREYKSLDDIIKLYFGGRYGLPNNFLPALIKTTPCKDFGGVGSQNRCCLSSCGDKCGGAGADYCDKGDQCCSADALGRVCGTDPLPCFKSPPTCSDFVSGGIGSPNPPFNRCCLSSCGDKCGGAGADYCDKGDQCCYADAVGRVCGRDPLPCFM